MHQSLYQALRTVAPPVARRYAREVFGTSVRVRIEARSLPPLAGDIAPFAVRLMDSSDARDIAAWLRIQSESFGSDMDPAVFDRIVRRHPTYDVRRTYFLLDHDEPAGICSAAVFKRNPAIGVGHQLALLPRVRGKGLGFYLARFRYQSLVEEGLQQLEMETTLYYRQAIRNHFRMGFRPKPHRDEWNQRDGARGEQRLLANLILEGRYLEWKLRGKA
jgi:GNAT superfamily N-acetyltransferase